VPQPPPDLLHDAGAHRLPREPPQELLPVHLLFAHVSLRVVVLRVGRGWGGAGDGEHDGGGRRTPQEGNSVPGSRAEAGGELGGDDPSGDGSCGHGGHGAAATGRRRADHGGGGDLYENSVTVGSSVYWSLAGGLTGSPFLEP
jgi:hypothetical protein